VLLVWVDRKVDTEPVRILALPYGGAISGIDRTLPRDRLKPAGGRRMPERQANASPGREPDAAQLLTMQRLAGNSAVGRLLAASRPAMDGGGLSVQRFLEHVAGDDYIDRARGDVKLKKVRLGYQVVGREDLGTLRYDAKDDKYYDSSDDEVEIGKEGGDAGNKDRYVGRDEGIGVVAGPVAVKIRTEGVLGCAVVVLEGEHAGFMAHVFDRSGLSGRADAGLKAWIEKAVEEFKRAAGQAPTRLTIMFDPEQPSKRRDWMEALIPAGLKPTWKEDRKIEIEVSAGGGKEARWWNWDIRDVPTK
jgi:hypothetical protein